MYAAPSAFRPEISWRDKAGEHCVTTQLAYSSFDDLSFLASNTVRENLSEALQQELHSSDETADSSE